MAGKDEILAAAICEAVYEIDPELILLCLSGSKMMSAAKKIGLRAASEFLRTEPTRMTARLSQEASRAQS